MKWIALNTSFYAVGNVNPTHTLPANKWEPVHPGYDFLEFIDKETAQLASHGRLHLPINVTTIADNSKSSGQAAHMEGKLVKLVSVFYFS